MMFKNLILYLLGFPASDYLCLKITAMFTLKLNTCYGPKLEKQIQAN